MITTVIPWADRLLYSVLCYNYGMNSERMYKSLFIERAARRRKERFRSFNAGKTLGNAGRKPFQPDPVTLPVSAQYFPAYL